MSIDICVKWVKCRPPMVCDICTIAILFLASQPFFAEHMLKGTLFQLCYYEAFLLDWSH